MADATRRVTAAQAHRGPDADGLEVRPFGGGWCGLGHRRLAFLDLSPLGTQPMIHPPSGGWIVFNGEVYNYARLRVELEGAGERFRTGSDTEVLLAGLARYGPRFVERLQGMYAFAHLDPAGPTVTLGRDPAGIKPLYLAAAGDYLVFASEVRAVLASGLVPRTVSRPAVAGLLAYGAVPQPLTVFEPVRMFPAGAVAAVRASGPAGWTLVAPTVWWRPPPPEPAPDPAELVRRTRDLLTAAVRDHLISDVPVGVFLSAGLDSTALAGLAAAHDRSVRAFTVAVGDQPDFDELAEAARTAERFGLAHTAIPLPSEATAGAVGDWLAAADQPSQDGLNTFVISRAVRAAGVKAALSGLGADELFGGYPSFREVPRLARLRWAVGWLPRAGRRAAARAAAVARPPAVRDKLGDLLAGPAGVGHLAVGRRRVLTDAQLGRLGLAPGPLGLTPDWLPPEAAARLPQGGDVGWAVSVAESVFYQGNTLLRDSDANAMAHALEIRVPFLDQRLMDFAHRLPGAVRFPAGRPAKWLLRAAVADLFDPALLARPKTGFQLPTRRWMAGPLRPTCEAGLAAVKRAGLLADAGVDAVWAEFAADPEGRAWSRALTLVALGDYLTRHA